MADLADLERAAKTWTSANIRAGQRRALVLGADVGSEVARRAVTRSSGALLASISTRMSRASARTLAAHLTSNAPHASVTEYGGSIKAKSGYLAIPLQGQKRGPNAEDGLFVRLARSGHPFLARRLGDGIEPRFALRKVVKRSGTGGMAKGFRAMAAKVREEATQELIDLISLGTK